MSIDFKKKYDRTEYKEFFRDGLLPDDYTESRDEDITRPHSYSYIKNVVKLGEYKPWDLKVYEIEHESENDPRVSLSKETFKMMISYGVENALVIFTSRNSDNFRLSLVTINLKFEEGTKIHIYDFERENEVVNKINDIQDKFFDTFKLLRFLIKLSLSLLLIGLKMSLFVVILNNKIQGPT